ncbi:hypothetical protein HMPREF1549_02656 [Actinomyces johnsonii F0510]|uniref:DUF418 domain-containing protein n=2 Tax=Actinomyces johnsonii TaxID=544581 RepID=U1R8Q5_9ACTO|nr:hypothetical protein HMPREF1549_02656 [Actinomyces johnsonii F0510]
MFNGMHLITSFTGSRGVRYPSPDVARGFMLLLIAVANIPQWSRVPAESASTFRASAADAWWVFVRTLFVDHRAYPLFAMLFGFGLMTMINRRIASGTQSYLQSLPGVDADREPTPQEEAWAREQATVDARRLVRRRGAWMILFGFVHGIFFVGDIIGVYGLVAVVFAGWLSRKRYTALCIVGVVIAVVVVCAYMAIDLFAPEMAAQMSGEQTSLTPTTLPWFVVNISSWIYALFAQFLITLIVPAAVIGARLADTGIIIHPELHRGLLAAMGIGGLTLGVGGALHSALTKVMSISAWPWDFAAKEVFGLVGACGWLALLALYAGEPREDGRLTGLRKLASAVGRRSMTAYLSQTILFGFIFVIVPLLVTGERLWLGQAAAALVAAAVWLTTVGLCAVLERGRHAGPFETLLRTAVARSERKRATAAPPAVRPDDV